MHINQKVSTIPPATAFPPATAIPPARATITHEGISASGTFYFDTAGAMVRFDCTERYYMDAKQGNVLKPFTVLVGPYKQQGPFRIPTSLKAVWNLEAGDYDYWKGTIEEVRYQVRLG